MGKTQKIDSLVFKLIASGPSKDTRSKLEKITSKKSTVKGRSISPVYSTRNKVFINAPKLTELDKELFLRNVVPYNPTSSQINTSKKILDPITDLMPNINSFNSRKQKKQLYSEIQKNLQKYNFNNVGIIELYDDIIKQINQLKIDLTATNRSSYDVNPSDKQLQKAENLRETLTKDIGDIFEQHVLKKYKNELYNKPSSAISNFDTLETLINIQKKYRKNRKIPTFVNEIINSEFKKEYSTKNTVAECKETIKKYKNVAQQIEQKSDIGDALSEQLKINSTIEQYEKNLTQYNDKILKAIETLKSQSENNRELFGNSVLSEYNLLTVDPVDPEKKLSLTGKINKRVPFFNFKSKFKNSLLAHKKENNNYLKNLQTVKQSMRLLTPEKQQEIKEKNKEFFDEIENFQEIPELRNTYLCKAAFLKLAKHVGKNRASKLFNQLINHPLVNNRAVGIILLEQAIHENKHMSITDAFITKLTQYRYKDNDTNNKLKQILDLTKKINMANIQEQFDVLQYIESSFNRGDLYLGKDIDKLLTTSSKIEEDLSITKTINLNNWYNEDEGQDS